MGVEHARLADRCPAHMRNHCMCIDAGGLSGEMLAMICCPRLPFDDRHAVRVVGDAPAMAMHQPLAVAPALFHQRVLRFHKATLHPRWFVGAQRI